MVDPLSGDTLWIRHDMPLGCDLFGDDQYILALPPSGEAATVLRALDGEILGTRKAPRMVHRQAFSDGKEATVFGRLEETCLTTLGRKLLLWWPEGNQPAVDPG